MKNGAPKQHCDVKAGDFIHKDGKEMLGITCRHVTMVWGGDDWISAAFI